MAKISCEQDADIAFLQGKEWLFRIDRPCAPQLEESGWILT